MSEKVGPLNLTAAREQALSLLLDYVVDGGVYPPAMDHSGCEELKSVRDLLQYRKTKRKSDDKQRVHEKYRDDRDALIPQADKIAELKLWSKKNHYGLASGDRNVRNAQHAKYFSEAMDVLSHIHLGCSQSWLDREIKGNPNFLGEYFHEVESLQMSG